jgi:hypothetical protein
METKAGRWRRCCASGSGEDHGPPARPPGVAAAGRCRDPRPSRSWRGAPYMPRNGTPPTRGRLTPTRAWPSAGRSHRPRRLCVRRSRGQMGSGCYSRSTRPGLQRAGEFRRGWGPSRMSPPHARGGAAGEGALAFIVESLRPIRPADTTDPQVLNRGLTLSVCAGGDRRSYFAFMHPSDMPPPGAYGLGLGPRRGVVAFVAGGTRTGPTVTPGNWA